VTARSVPDHRYGAETGPAPRGVRRPQRPDAEVIHLIPARKAVGYDPDAPQMPPAYWDSAAIGKYYRPLKAQISFRIDNEVLDWLKSKGQGRLSRINEILRERMAGERQ
jgi:uncharacterized protein (DUF4415 family)